jgi:hypothetical protein
MKLIIAYRLFLNLDNLLFKEEMNLIKKHQINSGTLNNVL